MGRRLLSHKKQILKSASLISLITLVSRILGYVRDLRIMLLLGTTPLADAFVLAYRIPSLLRRMVGEGAMTAPFIPVFADYQAHHSREEVWEFANRLFWTLAAVLAVISLGGMLFSTEAVRLFTFFGPGRPEVQQAAYLNRIMFPYVFFVGLSALAMAILNCFHIFGLPAATPIWLNLAIIGFSAGAVWKHFSNPAVSLAVGVLVGGVLQFLVLVPPLARKGMHFDFGLSLRHPGVRAVARVMPPGVLGIGAAQINFSVGTMFATAGRMPPGSPTALYVAERVMELVLGGFAIAVATAILPLMSHQAAAGDYDNLKTTLAFALRIVSFITIPAAVGLIVLREPIIRVLFEHGQFGTESTGLTSRALFYYAFGLPAFAAIKLIVPAFYSAHDTRTPATIAAYSVGLNAILNVLCLVVFFSVFGNGGPALATVVSAYFNFFALFAVFRIRFGRMRVLEVLLSMARIGLCSGLMGAACWVALRVSDFGSYQEFLPRLAVLTALVMGSVGTYLGLGWIFRAPEIGEVYGIVRQQESEPMAASGVGE